MPIKRKDKSEKAQNNDHSLKKLFNRHNKEKVTFKGIQEFFTTICYRLGYSAEMTVLVALKQIREYLHIAFYVYIKRFYKEAKIFIHRMLSGVLEEIGFPLSRIKASIFNIRSIVKNSKDDDSINTNKEVAAYIKQGFNKHKKYIPALISYTFTFACFCVMVAVIAVGLNQNYVIKLSIDGEDIAYVNNYTAVTNANKVIQNKLVTLDDRQWNVKPAVEVVTAYDKTVVDERQLSDIILTASDEDIVSATGFYVDGVFYGAVQDRAKIEAALNSMLEPYMDGSENKTVTFVQNVALTDGVFFTDTLVNEDDLANQITGLVAGEVWYTVVEGDSPSLIASKNGLRLAELYSLNPGLEGGGLWIGDQVLVSQAVQFLQVKEVVREVRDVEVEFSREVQPNNSMSINTVKTIQEGENGLNRVTVDVTYIDGVIQSETVISTEVIKEPVTEIVEEGRYIPNVGVITNTGSGTFGWPTGGGVRVSRGFAGQYPAHNGVDIAGPYGTPIYASDSGVVTLAKYTNSGYGIYCVIEHGNGYQTLYGHCSSLAVTYGQTVEKGQIIAYMGSTGWSTGNHVHFEIKSGDYRYDPYSFWY